MELGYTLLHAGKQAILVNARQKVGVPLLEKLEPKCLFRKVFSTASWLIVDIIGQL